MNDRTNMPIGVIAAMLVALCCGAPLLIVALGALSTAGLMAWFSESVYVVIPVLFVGLGLVSVWLYRRGARTKAGRNPNSREGTF